MFAYQSNQTELLRHVELVALMEEIMDPEIAKTCAEMLQRTTEQLIKQGMHPDKAAELADRALNAPPKFNIPTIEELGHDE